MVNSPFTHLYRGVPTERGFLEIGASIAIERNNLKPSNSENTFSVRFNVSDGLGID